MKPISAVFLLVLSAALLQGCIRSTARAVGSGVGSVASGVGSVASGAVSVAGSAAGTAASAAGSAASGAASAVGGAGSSTAGTTTAAASSGSTGLATPETLALAGGTVFATGVAAATTIPETGAITPRGSIVEGVTACLAHPRQRDRTAAALTDLSWATETAATGSRPAAMSKLRVQGSLWADGDCDFRAADQDMRQSASAVLRQLEASFPGQVRAGSPEGRTGACDGATVTTPGFRAWVHFLSASGGDCREGGTGVTVTML